MIFFEETKETFLGGGGDGTEFLCIALAVLELMTGWPRNSQQFSFFCFLLTGMKGVYYQAWPKDGSYGTIIFNLTNNIVLIEPRHILAILDFSGRD